MSLRRGVVGEASALGHPSGSSKKSAKSALRLSESLQAFIAHAPQRQRVAADPVQFPHRYINPRDVEVSGLLAASLAYGRVELFAPKVNALLQQMGPSPSEYVKSLTLPRARRLLSNFVYRFNVGADLGVLLLGMGRVLQKHGSLERQFALCLQESRGLHGALSGFTAALRDVPMAPLTRALGDVRGLDHLLPSPLGPGAAKRLNLFLRWMVRGPDEVDFGIWRQISPSALVIPLDTHIGRIAKRLGLTQRNDLSWRTAEEVTAALRQVDAEDPVRFDFALCHHGMAGICPPTPYTPHCVPCLLRPACRVGQRRVRHGV